MLALIFTLYVLQHAALIESGAHVAAAHRDALPSKPRALRPGAPFI